MTNEKDKEKETAIEKCEFELQARDDVSQCRLVFKLYCRFSVVKTFRLVYETAEMMHATFDKQNSPNTWTITSRTLRDVVEYFGPKTDHVDWSLHEGKVTFTSYTEKIQVGSEIIRQPTHTSVQLDGQDFDECKIEKDLHISIPVKDFRSIVAHAETMKASVKAAYSRGHRPTQITYSSGGLTAEFTLMTRGTSSQVTDSSRTSTPARGLSMRPTSQSGASSRGSSVAAIMKTAPAVRPQLQSSQLADVLPASGPTSSQARTIQGIAGPQAKLKASTSTDTAPPASMNPDSLFFPAPEDDDQQWDPPNFDEEPEMVTWDNTGASGIWEPASHIRKRAGMDDSFAGNSDSAAASFRSALQSQTTGKNHRGSSTADQTTRGGDFEIAPTQGRLSQMKGIFD